MKVIKMIVTRPAWQLPALGLLLSAALFVIYFFPPDQHAFYPRCIFHSLTGWECPGCGGTRAVYQLLHGHLLAAMDLNLLFFAAAPLILVGVIFKYTGRMQNTWILLNRPMLVLILVLAFWIGRNLPLSFLQWLSAAN